MTIKDCQQQSNLRCWVENNRTNRNRNCKDNNNIDCKSCEEWYSYLTTHKYYLTPTSISLFTRKSKQRAGPPMHRHNSVAYKYLYGTLSHIITTSLLPRLLCLLLCFSSFSDSVHIRASSLSFLPSKWFGKF